MSEDLIYCNTEAEAVHSCKAWNECREERRLHKAQSLQAEPSSHEELEAVLTARVREGIPPPYTRLVPPILPVQSGVPIIIYSCMNFVPADLARLDCGCLARAYLWTLATCSDLTSF